MNNQGDVINSGTFNSDSVNIIDVYDSDSVNKKKAARLEYELKKQWWNRIENINHPLFNKAQNRLESGHSSKPDLTIEKTVWKSDDDMMSIVEYEHYGIVDNFESESSDPSDLIDFKLSTISSAIEASNEVDRIEKFSHPLFDSKSGHNSKPLISSSNPKPIETNLKELSTKSESSILSVKNSVCLMFVFVVLYISLRFMKRAY